MSRPRHRAADERQSPGPTARIRVGELAPSADIHLDVTLKPPDPSAVTAFITSLSDRSSSNFRHFLLPGQFGRLFGPPLSEVAAVDTVLRSDGLRPGQVEVENVLDPGDEPWSR